jgi:undecaprenyl diphosphate synthase
VGKTENLSSGLLEGMAESQRLTSKNTGITLNVAIDYGGRAEILEAVRRIVKDRVDPETIDEDLFSRYLFTAQSPDPDLIIRTGGEQRISNFLLWQSAYSEMHHTPTLWPDLDAVELTQILKNFGNRRRRYGALNAEDQSPESPTSHQIPQE